MPTAHAACDSSALSVPGARRAFPAILSLRRAVKWAAYLVLGLAAVFVSAGTVAPALLGYHSTTVYGGSMGSNMPAGSVAVTETVGFEDVRVGDVIAFARGDRHQPVMHRVTAIDERDGQRFATLRGDSNGAADTEPLVLASGQGDRLVYHVPLLGYVLHYARTTTVLVPAFIGVVLLLAFEWFRTQRRARIEPKT